MNFQEKSIHKQPLEDTQSSSCNDSISANTSLTTVKNIKLPETELTSFDGESRKVLFA